MIDSNNINIMREKLRKISGGSGVIEEIERIDNLIGSSPIPGAQRTITGSLNYLYDNIGGIKTKEYIGDGTTTLTLEFDEIPSYILGWSSYDGSYQLSLAPFKWGAEKPTGATSVPSTFSMNATYDNNKITVKGSDARNTMNFLNVNYSIIYI